MGNSSSSTKAGGKSSEIILPEDLPKYVRGRESRSNLTDGAAVSDNEASSEETREVKKAGGGTMRAPTATKAYVDKFADPTAEEKQFLGGLDDRYKLPREDTVELLSAMQPGSGGQQVAGDGVTDYYKWVKEHEGLDIGNQKKKELGNQMAFFLGSEPIQRGMDAGFVLGCFVAGGAFAFGNKKAMNPLRLCYFWLLGFSVGMMGVPMTLMFKEMAAERRMLENTERVNQELRADYHKRQREGGAGRGKLPDSASLLGIPKKPEEGPF